MRTTLILLTVCGWAVSLAAQDDGEAIGPVHTAAGMPTPFSTVDVEPTAPEVVPTHRTEGVLPDERREHRIEYDHQRWSTRFPWLVFDTYLGRDEDARRVTVRTPAGPVRVFHVVGGAGTSNDAGFAYAIIGRRIYLYDLHGRVSVHDRRDGRKLEEVGPVRGEAIPRESADPAHRWDMLPVLGRARVMYAFVRSGGSSAYLVSRRGTVLARRNLLPGTSDEEGSGFTHLRATPRGLRLERGESPTMTNAREQVLVEGRDLPFSCF